MLHLPTYFPAQSFETTCSPESCPIRKLLDSEDRWIPETLENSRTELLHMRPQRTIQSAPEGLRRWYDLALTAG